MKLAAAVLAMFVIAIPATATAEDELPVCPAERTLIMSAGGPLCVADMYLDGDGPWADPTPCQWGYLQGWCAPEPQRPTVFDPAMYLFQIDAPTAEQVAWAEAASANARTAQVAWDARHTPTPSVAEVVTVQDVVVGKVAQFRAGLAALLG